MAILKMRLLPLAFLFALAPTVGAVGCKPDPEKKDHSSIAADDLPSELGKAFCSTLFRCCEAGEIKEGAADEAQCAQRFVDESSDFWDDVDAAIDAGRAKYDADAAAACVSAIRGAACGAGVEELLDSAAPQACERMIVGTAAAGGECEADVECAGGGQCVVENGASKGACVALAAEGQPCADVGCAEDLVCLGDTAETQVCSRPRADGEPCNSGYECASENCSAELKCVPKGEVGEPCSNFGACVDAYCDAQTSTCAARKAAGSPCQGPDECESDTCGDDGTCAAALPAACDGK